MTSELKPCPFCNGKAQIYGHLCSGFCVKCSTCSASVGHSYDEQWFDGAYDTEQEAISAWNQREERTCKLASSSKVTGLEKASWDLRLHTCSECRKPSIDLLLGYCPNCGAKVVC